MARPAASDRSIAAARSAAALRTALGSYRIPQAFIDLGITRLWDFRTGYQGLNSPFIANMLGGGAMQWRGGTPIASAFTAGRYQIDLERTTTNDYLATNPMVLTNGMTALTCFAWIKQESAVGGQVRNILTHWESSTGNFRGFSARVNGSHQMEVFFSPDGTLANQAAYTTTETLTDTAAWHLVIWQYDTTNRGIITLDNVAQTTALTIGSHPASINSSEVAVMLGSIVPSAPANFYDGLLGICGIAENKSMSVTEKTQLLNLTNAIGAYV